MVQAISSVFKPFIVKKKKDGVDNSSLISHEQQGASYFINFYHENDTEEQQTSSSEPRLDLITANQGLCSSVVYNSTVLCFDRELENGTIYSEDIKNVITSEEEPTRQAKQAFCIEEENTTKIKADIVNNGSKLESETIIMKERRIGPYTSSQTMLLVGEGDFSFSASLAEAFVSATNILPTSLDSREFLSTNYKHAMKNILKLTERGSTVLHGVDCTKMGDIFSGMKFDRVIYNFPHSGFYGRDEPRESQLYRHRTLVRLFLVNAKKLVNRESGEIDITHKSWGFFLEWDLKSLAMEEGLVLIEEVPFNRKDYPGYHTMCGFGGNRFFVCSPCRTYKFGHPQCTKSFSFDVRKFSCMFGYD